METLENQYLIAKINPVGAELKSLVFKPTHNEIIWQGNDEFWNRSAPILFPFVGKLRENSYQYGNKIYKMDQHGFARDQPFEVVKNTGDKITLRLSENPETYKSYPFKFELFVTYFLTENTITTTFLVNNTHPAQPLLFSLGGHPAFNVDLMPISNYQLIFNKPDKLERHLLIDGLFSGETESLKLKNQGLKLTEDLFSNDALVFKNLKTTFLKLENLEADYSIEFEFNNFPYLGIWKKPNAPFICLEPWCGLADNIEFTEQLIDKEGINVLNFGEIFTRSYSITPSL